MPELTPPARGERRCLGHEISFFGGQTLFEYGRPRCNHSQPHGGGHGYGQFRWKGRWLYTDEYGVEGLQVGFWVGPRGASGDRGDGRGGRNASKGSCDDDTRPVDTDRLY